MPSPAPSALISDKGKRVHFRLQGRLYEVGQDELRALLGLPPGPSGLGITVVQNRFRFEFAMDRQEVEISAAQLRRRLTELLTSKV